MLATRTASVNAGDRVQAGDGRHAGALGGACTTSRPVKAHRQMTRVGQAAGARLGAPA